MVEQSERPAESILIEDPHGKRATLRLAPGMSVAIIGLDGTGKSTASEMLEKALTEAGLPTTCFHWYSARQTCFMVPVAVLRNRASRKSVQIFDRSIFDNFAVWSQRVGSVPVRNRLLTWAAWLAQRLYPRFDAIVHLTAAPEVIAQRRPEMTPGQIALGREVYAVLSAVLKTEPLDTVSIKRAAA
jgi:energy-coupling factor transporter ATP-binding protein EcfA2